MVLATAHQVLDASHAPTLPAAAEAPEQLAAEAETRFAYCRLGHLLRYLPNTGPATTSGCGPPRHCWPRRSATWPGSARRDATACG